MYCIDASVLTAIFDESDSFHQTSLELFEFITKADMKIVMPVFALVEVAGALARKGYRNDDVVDYLNFLRGSGSIEFLALTVDLCELAAEIALQLKVKGSDSIYIAISQRHGLKLITNDNQQRERGNAMIAATTPEEELLSIRG